MRRYFIVLAALLLSACQLEGEAGTPSESLSTAEVKPKLVMVSYSETPVPTATIDYQATIALVQQEAQRAQQEADQAQAEADAAKRLMVDATVTHEAVMLIAAQMTQSSEILSAQGTQAAVNATASVAPTSIPLTATMQSVNNSVRETQQASNDPTFIEARANAEAYAENAGMLMTVEIGLKWAIALFVVALGAALVIFVMRSEPKKEEPVEVRAFVPIPMRKDTSNGQYKMKKIRTDVPCSKEQLMVLAEGILVNGMTLAINPWQKTIVHKSIDDIRQFFLDNEWAHKLKSKNGELFLLEVGEEWLDQCLARGEPPEPYACVIPSPEPVSGSNLIPVI
jgi:hypothetical protein